MKCRLALRGVLISSYQVAQTRPAVSPPARNTHETSTGALSEARSASTETRARTAQVQPETRSQPRGKDSLRDNLAAATRSKSTRGREITVSRATSACLPEARSKLTKATR